MCCTTVMGQIYTTRSVVKSWRMLVAHNSRNQTSYRLNRPWYKQRTQRSDHVMRGSLGRGWKQWKILKPSSQQAVAVVFKGFQQDGSDWEIVVFWIGGLLRRVIRAPTKVDCIINFVILRRTNLVLWWITTLHTFIPETRAPRQTWRSILCHSWAVS